MARITDWNQLTCQKVLALALTIGYFFIYTYKYRMERSPADFPSHFPFLPLDSCYCPPKMNSNSNQVDHSRGESTDSSGTLIPSPRASAFSKSPIPPTIPTRRDYRTLVLCFDGTGDQ